MREGTSLLTDTQTLGLYLKRCGLHKLGEGSHDINCVLLGTQWDRNAATIKY